MLSNAYESAAVLGALNWLVEQGAEVSVSYDTKPYGNNLPFHRPGIASTAYIPSANLP